MATFYRGHRPVLRGRSSNVVHTWKGEVGNYSNWHLMNTSQVLSGAPDRHVEPGAGNHPHGLSLSRRFRGLDTSSPMDDPGEGVRLLGHRFRPLEHKGLEGAEAMGDPGHAPRPNAFTWSRTVVTNHLTEQPLDDAGHAQRSVGDAGAAASFGAFGPWTHKGVGQQPMADPGRVKPDADDPDVYGHQRVNEWAGVPSAKAL